MRHAKYLSLLLILSLSSCFSSVPPNNAAFADIELIRQFCGTYRNLGVAEHFDPHRRICRLSSLILGPCDDKTSEAIEKIEVSCIANNALYIKGLAKDGNALLARQFIMGKDFTLQDGKILLCHKCEGMAPLGLGFYWTSSNIGLDERKDGKFQRREAIAGLVACCIPLAMSETEEVRFERCK